MSSPRIVPVGLAGCGWIAEIAHVPALIRSKAGRLAAAADADPARGAWIGSRVPGIRLHQDWRNLLGDADLGAIVVALPSAMHGGAAIDILAAGKPLFLEKPIALSLEAGRRVYAAWRRSGVAAGVGYNFRRNPNVMAARSLIRSGDLGDLVTMQTMFHWAADRIEGWRALPGQGGGALHDLASHHVDLVSFLAGAPVTRVQGAVRSCRTPDDTAALTAQLQNGVMAQIHATSVAGAPVNRIEITGSRGHLSVDLLSGHPKPVERRPGRGARLLRARRAVAELHPARLLRSPGFEPSFGATIEAFLEAVRGGTPPTPDLADGFHALAVVAAGLDSARSNGEWRPVEAAE